MICTLDPRTKLLASAMLVGASFCVQSPKALSVLGAAFLILAYSCRMSFKLYGQRLLMIVWLLAATFLTHVWGHAADVLGGGIAVARIGIVLGWVTLLGSSSTALELVNGLERLCLPLRRLGVPVRQLSLVAMLSMRFLPVLVEEGRALYQAGLARGLEWNHGSLSTRLQQIAIFLLPLFSHLLRRVDRLTLAMENRAFQPGRERTSLSIQTLGVWDYAVLAGCAPLLLAACMWR
ncbi:hypothetical protein CSB45_08755 [candidate division KSB3 bacterium]|uniref:Energy-coupling factor transporter transmembrane protein EcfT n=1 Tax=candidate division KSB3 bacterium TaxID=2044937 RepID=A0A2G6E4L3_9BACT|nr:MAG: hypothetical protein CSB45_08755 [candidate division KSB3 bacterium]PIE29689.1 MAG: hypothetical protein CSA57_07680 [candidate division KSB3 bacterium]